MFLALTLGIVGTTWGLISASKANRELVASNTKLDTALKDAEAQRNLAQENEATAKAESKRHGAQWQHNDKHLSMQVTLGILRQERQAGDHKRQQKAVHQAQGR